LLLMQSDQFKALHFRCDGAADGVGLSQVAAAVAAVSEYINNNQKSEKRSTRVSEKYLKGQ